MEKILLAQKKLCHGTAFSCCARTGGMAANSIMLTHEEIEKYEI